MMIIIKIIIITKTLLIIIKELKKWIEKIQNFGAKHF